MNSRIGPLGKLDRFRKQKHMHAVQMQLISNLFRGGQIRVVHLLLEILRSRYRFLNKFAFSDGRQLKHLFPTGKEPVTSRHESLVLTTRLPFGGPHCTEVEFAHLTQRPRVLRIPCLLEPILVVVLL